VGPNRSIQGLSLNTKVVLFHDKLAGLFVIYILFLLFFVARFLSQLHKYQCITLFLFAHVFKSLFPHILQQYQFGFSSFLIFAVAHGNSLYVIFFRLLILGLLPVKMVIIKYFEPL
jgi:hypothetical protein